MSGQTLSVRALLIVSRLDAHLEDSLARLRAQDYPGLHATIAVPAAVNSSATDNPSTAHSGTAQNGLANRVRSILPESDICEYDPASGYGVVINQAASVSQSEDKASLLFVCSDSVVLKSDTVSRLVEQLVQLNAGVVAPKLVKPDDPLRLVSAGFSIDRTGGKIPTAAVGELDQGQHDGINAIFGVASSCLLIRSDLMTALHGFSEEITFFGEDLDFCWRVHLATAQIALVPSVAVGCYESGLESATLTTSASRLSSSQLPPNANKLRWRHRLFSLLTCPSAAGLAVSLPLVALASTLESVMALTLGHPRTARDICLAWWWNIFRLPQVVRKRRQIALMRYARDHELRPLQVDGLAELRLFWRSQRTDGSGGLAHLVRGLADWFRNTVTRSSVLVWLIILIFLGFGSRHLLSKGIPQIGQFSAFPASPGKFFSQWFSSLQGAGLGSDGFNSIALGILGVWSTLLLGAMGLARTLVVLLPIPLGALGVVRLLRRQGGRSVGWIGAVVYLSLPLPYNALANGSWDALLFYGMLPWIVSVMLVDVNLPATAPNFLRNLATSGKKDNSARGAAVVRGAGGASRDGTHGGTPSVQGVAHRANVALKDLKEQSLWRSIIIFSLLTAAVTAFVPAALVLILLCVVALAIGSEFLGVRSAKLLTIGFLGSALAFVLSLPQLASSWWPVLVRDSDLASNTDDVFGVWELIRFATGPINNAALGWGLLLVAALPLLVVHDMRFVWVVRGWILVCLSVALAWIGERSENVVPSADLLLVPAGVGFAIAAAMGVAALAADLPRYRFGWRQLLPLAGAMGLVIMVVPIVTNSFDGRWNMSKHDYATPLAALDDDSYRVLWLGHPDVLPGRAYELTDDVSYVMTGGVSTQVADLWVFEPNDAPLKETISLVRTGASNRLGRLLAPMGILHIVVLETRTPPPEVTLSRPVEPWVENMLKQQLDMRQVDLREGIVVYENISAQPTVLGVNSGSLASTESFGDAVFVPFLNTSSGLSCGSQANTAPLGCDVERGSSTGLLQANSDVYIASGSSNWEVEINAQKARRTEAFGWAQVFSGSEASETTATARHKTPAGYQFLIALQLCLWLAGLAILLFTRRPQPKSSP